MLAFLPKARAQAAFYNCSNSSGGGGALCINGTCDGSPCRGLHFPGHIAPWGFDATLAGEPWASMADHSNGVYASLNMIQEWEYSRNTSFLRTVAFPFCRDTLRFYQGWMHRRADGSWVNEHDQANECTAGGTVAGVFSSCWQNNTVFSNGFARRVASALPAMAAHLGEPVDPQWAELTLGLDALPTIETNGTQALPFEPPRRVIVLAGNYTNITSGQPACGITCGTRVCGRPCPAQVAGDGMMDVMGVSTTLVCVCVYVCLLRLPLGRPSLLDHCFCACTAWPVWPGEAIGLASPESLQQTVRDTLQLSAEWRQGNSFCSIFSQAARVRMPLEFWLPEFRAVIEKDALENMIVYQGGGGMEVAGALQVVADLMLQSVTLPGISGEYYLALFPMRNLSFSDLRFVRLRGKGAFVVSAAYNAAAQRLDGPVTVESEVGGRCSLELPPSQATDTVVVATRGGAAVAVAREQGPRWSFQTKAGESYTVTAQKNLGFADRAGAVKL